MAEADAAGIGPAAFYALYAGMFVVAIWWLTGDARLRAASTVAGAATFAAGIANSYAPSSGAALAVYLTSLAYHAAMIVVLVRYTFGRREVATPILLAATCLYLVIGSAFAALYGVILWLNPDAFVSSLGEPVSWQSLLYFSYVTLTTLGYGDILPQGHYARAFAVFEAVAGTLYTVILLSRLVGLHASGGAAT